jgi:uncharacterized OB-fold protein
MSDSGDPSQSIWPGYSSEDADGPFLVGATCQSCGFTTLGKRAHCPSCWSEATMRSIPIGRRGVVYTRTVVHSAPPGFEAPYAVGYVDLKEGVRVFAHLETGDKAPAIGDPVELTLVPLRTDKDGRRLTGPRFRKPA